MLIAGVSAAVLLPTTAALTGDLSPSERRGAAMGGFNLFGSVGFGTGPVIAGIMAESYGFSITFLFAGFSVILILLMMLPFLRKLEIDLIRENKR